MTNLLSLAARVEQASGAEWRVVMRHPSGTVFLHTGSLFRQLLDWRAWLWCWRNSYRFRIEKVDAAALRARAEIG